MKDTKKCGIVLVILGLGATAIAGSIALVHWMTFVFTDTPGIGIIGGADAPTAVYLGGVMWRQMGRYMIVGIAGQLVAAVGAWLILRMKRH